MRRYTLLFAICVGLPVSAAAEASKIVVMPLSPKRIDADVAAVLDDLLVVAVSKAGPYRVVGAREVNALLRAEGLKDKLGCNDVTCATEIGGALAARLIVIGSVARLGDEVHLSATLFDSEKMEAVRRAQTAVPRQREDLFDGAVSLVVAELFGLPPPQTAPAPTLGAMGRVRPQPGELLADAPSGTGGLRIASEPEGARVFRDDELVGTTPLVLRELPVGSVELRLTKDGHDDARVHFRVLDKRLLDETVRLQPWNEVQLTSSPPGARVFIDEMPRGVTPLAVKLPTRTYDVRLELKKHAVWRSALDVSNWRDRALYAELPELEEVYAKRRNRILVAIFGFATAAGLSAGGLAMHLQSDPPVPAYLVLSFVPLAAYLGIWGLVTIPAPPEQPSVDAPTPTGVTRE